MTDEQLAEQINAYLQDNPNASRRSIAVDNKVSRLRLLRMAEIGLIKLPPKIPLHISGKMGSKNSPWRNNFRLGGTPR